MLRVLVLILILLPTISNADQGLKISCLNMKSILGKKYEPLKFTLEAVGFQYFDEEKDSYDKDHSPWLKLSLTVSTVLILMYFVFPSELIDLVSRINII